jgi:hypothetical protein
MPLMKQTTRQASQSMCRNRIIAVWERRSGASQYSRLGMLIALGGRIRTSDARTIDRSGNPIPITPEFDGAKLVQKFVFLRITPIFSPLAIALNSASSSSVPYDTKLHTVISLSHTRRF